MLTVHRKSLAGCFFVSEVKRKSQKNPRAAARKGFFAVSVQAKRIAGHGMYRNTVTWGVGIKKDNT